MNIRLRLTVMNFLQFFIWGSWLISLNVYLDKQLHFSGAEIGAIYATMGVASLFMPALLGIIADKWMNAERLFGVMHILGALLLLGASRETGFSGLYPVMLLNSMAYMPTIALNNTVSYRVLQRSGLDIVGVFPAVRVWGTVGFVCAMWVVDLAGLTNTPYQLYLSAGSALFLGLYAFTMPSCPPSRNAAKRDFLSLSGLDAFVLLRRRKMAVFFIFAMLLGAALQITNAFGETFLTDFARQPRFAGSFAVTHPGILISVSQISETLFILTIPFFLRRFGIRMVMLMSIGAWVLRFGLFGVGDPGSGLPYLLLSMVIYGMAFDFFNISGSLFVEREAGVNIRASAQGLFMVMTNGVGAFVGGVISGRVVDYFTTHGQKDWQAIWFSFAAYALLLAVFFPIVFRYRHRPAEWELAEAVPRDMTPR